MADAIFSAFVSDMVSRGISFVFEHFGHQQSTEAKLQRLCHMLTRVHSVVEEAKGRQITNDGTLQWLSELIDGEFQGRYLLDTIRSGEHDIEEDEHDGDKVAPPRAFSISVLNPLKRVRIATKDVLLQNDAGVDEIHRVLESLQGISGDLKEFIMLMQNCQPIGRPLPTNIFVDGQMFGRHVEKERIVNFLLHDGGGSIGKLGVLAIVGDIGVGKTTLVQHACDDARVRNHFPVIILCCTYAIAANGGTVVLQSKHVIGGADMNWNDPVQLDNGSFGNKRFLMVFEDMDMHKKKMLEGLLPVLRRECKEGSKVIVTTKNPRVATIGTVEPIILKALPFPEYWFFFKAHAFAGRDVEENPRLVALGKAIARKLNGSFFGAKIVGGVLRDYPNPMVWCKVLRSNIEGLSLLGDGIGYIADLAGNLLPSHVDMFLVTIFTDTLASHSDFTTLKDLSGGHGSEACLAAENINLVLLCKSVLPFCNYYHIAHCTVGSQWFCVVPCMPIISSLGDENL